MGFPQIKHCLSIKNIHFSRLANVACGQGFSQEFIKSGILGHKKPRIYKNRHFENIYIEMVVIKALKNRHFFGESIKTGAKRLFPAAG